MAVCNCMVYDTVLLLLRLLLV